MRHFTLPVPVRSLSISTVLVVWAALAPPPATAGQWQREHAKAIDVFVQSFVELGMFDGTILIDQGGEVVYETSFGLANYELGVRHSPATRFRIASVSKTLTDVAIAKLIEQGRLSLDDSLDEYLPDFPNAAKITLGRLLDHTSGIPHTNSYPWGAGRISLGHDELIERLAALPPDFEPGADRRYSNGAYAVAGKVLAIAIDGTYEDAMRELVFAPLSMRDSGHLGDARRPIEGMATGYEPGPFPGERRHPRFYAVETRPGGGSLYSTARDLLKLSRALFRDKFLPEHLVRDVLGADEGIFLAQGRSPGFVAKLYFDPDQDLIVVSLSNSYAVPADWAAAIARLATGESPSPSWGSLRAAPPTVLATDPRIGCYSRSRGDDRVEVRRNAHRALELVDRRSDSRTGLIPLDDGSFLLPIYFSRCRQDKTTREITCEMLSGNTRYTSVYSPAEDDGPCLPPPVP